jgi:hypothetical protein
MANFEGRCFIECKNTKVEMLEELILGLEELKQSVIEDNGRGAVGVLFGFCDYLKGMRKRIDV